MPGVSAQLATDRSLRCVPEDAPIADEKFVADVAVPDVHVYWLDALLARLRLPVVPALSVYRAMLTVRAPLTLVTALKAPAHFTLVTVMQYGTMIG